ncbi:MAG TPA: diacylglycerol kinase family lipid kinase [Phycisphaerales bacterium]|nr:diacylglycerol kinase family lipid kinase [Phycisphaerales bacterium]
MKPGDGYICFIVNPKSGAGSTRPLGRQFRQYLAARGFDIHAHVTRSLEHACELATDAAVDHDCALVVAVGGDGTVREVVRGLEGSDRPVLIVPGGTENLLASELGIDAHLQTLIDVFESGHIQRLDLGIVNNRCFTSIAGFGFDGEIVRRVSERRKGHITYADYVAPVWKTFWTYKYPAMTVTVDDKEFFSGRGLVFVGNIRRYGGGLRILRDANRGDGLLDVCVFKTDSRLSLLRMTLLMLLRSHIGAKNVLYKRARTITVTGDPAIRTQIDGDPGPALPVHIKVIPAAVNCLAPKGARPLGLRTRIKRIFG